MHYNVTNFKSIIIQTFSPKQSPSLVKVTLLKESPTQTLEAPKSDSCQRDARAPQNLHGRSCPSGPCFLPHTCARARNVPQVHRSAFARRCQFRQRPPAAAALLRGRIVRLPRPRVASKQSARALLPGREGGSKLARAPTRGELVIVGVSTRIGAGAPF